MRINPGCQLCGKPIPLPESGHGNGRPRRYCSPKCAKAAWHRRQRGSRPAARPRRPLPEFSASAGWSLRKNVERIERIVADDRFSANRQQVTARLRSHLEYAAQVCQDLLRNFDQPTGD